jgi:hypothetical protein
MFSNPIKELPQRLASKITPALGQCWIRFDGPVVDATAVDYFDAVACDLASCTAARNAWA